jgi:glycosyltransferase involved in cell wall biosynthesis
MTPRVGLVMIVKNEEAVIQRALLSVRPWITAWVIVDTGSTDRTKEIIQETLTDCSGLLVDRPWVSFGHNRTEALELCRGQMDWAIMLDADDTIEGGAPPAEVWTQDLDAIGMRICHDQIWHSRLQIFRVASDWAYKGLLHEVPVCRSTEKPKIAMLPQTFYMQSRCEGSRSRDPQKYLKDALLLEEEVARDPTDSRNVYYLAQSYRDAGRPRQAQLYYKQFLDLSGTWIHDRYMAMVNLILLVSDPQDQIDLAWSAVELQPARLEAPYTLLKCRREAGLPPVQQCYAMAAACRSVKRQADWPYMNPAIYEWGFDDELAVVAFATGHYDVALEALNRCAIYAPTPELRENAVKNARIAASKAASQ